MKGGRTYDNSVLTHAGNVDTTLCMKGKLRTKEKCPKCKGKFQGDPLTCLPCMTVPRKYYIDLHWKGQRIRLFCDKTGHALDSWPRGQRVLESIRYEIDQHMFDPSRYVKKDVNQFRFEHQVTRWIEKKEVEVKKGIKAESYTRLLRLYSDKYYKPYFQKWDVRDLRTYHIDEFYEKLPQTISPKYTKNIVNALENFFNFLHRQSLISEIPVFPEISVTRKTPKWIDKETQEEILDKIPEEDRPLFQYLAGQGIRPAEGRVLKVCDFDFNKGVLVVSRTDSRGKIKERVKSKVEKPRLINPAMLPMLKKACRGKHPNAFIFPNPRTGKPYSESQMHRIWNKARGKAGIEVTLYEATRHSLASQASSNGVPLQAIRDVLGHTDIRTTMVYAHNDLESQKVVFGYEEEKIVKLGDKNR